MKRIVTSILLAVTLLSGASAQKVRFMPQWTAQAQFAGYYMALEKGFYSDLGLDVSIIHMSANSVKSAVDYLDDGTVDIISNQLLTGIFARNSGVHLVNVLQTSQNNTLMCVSHNPIKSFRDLDGKKVGVWKAGHGEIAEIYASDYSLSIGWFNFNKGVNLFISKAVDATLCYSYNEYLSLLFAKGEIPAENVIRFADMGYNYPEDGLFVLEKYLKKNKDVVDKFKEASKKGWEYARANREETIDVVMRYTSENHISTNRVFQSMMLDEILDSQISREDGSATFAPINRELFNTINDKLCSNFFIVSPINYDSFIK